MSDLRTNADVNFSVTGDAAVVNAAKGVDNALDAMVGTTKEATNATNKNTEANTAAVKSEKAVAKATQDSSKASQEKARAVGNLQDGIVALTSASLNSKSGFVDMLRAVDNLGRVFVAVLPKLGPWGMAIAAVAVAARVLIEVMGGTEEAVKNTASQMKAAQDAIKDFEGAVSSLTSHMEDPNFFKLTPQQIRNYLESLQFLERAQREFKEVTEKAFKVEFGGVEFDEAGAKAYLDKQKALLGQAKANLDDALRARQAGELFANVEGYQKAFDAISKSVTGLEASFAVASAQRDQRIQESLESIALNYMKVTGLRKDLGLVEEKEEKEEEDRGNSRVNRQESLYTRLKVVTDAYYSDATFSARKHYFGLVGIAQEWNGKRLALEDSVRNRSLNLTLSANEIELKALEDKHAKELAEAQRHGLDVTELQRVQAHERTQVINRQADAALDALRRKQKEEKRLTQANAMSYIAMSDSIIGAASSVAETVGASEQVLNGLKMLGALADAAKSTANAYFAFASGNVPGGVGFTAAAAANVVAAVAYGKAAGQGGGGGGGAVPAPPGGGATSQPRESDFGGRGGGGETATYNVNNFNGTFFDTRDAADRALGARAFRGGNQNAMRQGRQRLVRDAIVSQPLSNRRARVR